MTRVVVTGLGVVGPWGAGRDGLLEDLELSRTRLVPLPAQGRLLERRGLAARPGAAWAGRVETAVPAPWLPGAAARRMSRPSRFAVAAARMALADAGLPDDGDAWRAVAEDTALVLSTAYGPSSVTEKLEEQILLTGPEAASPALFAESVANAPAAQVARLTGARGANLTVTSREAGALQAVHQAAAEVAAGRSPAALAGVADEVTALLQAVLDRFGSLARSRRPDDPPVARPFDRRRSGFVTGEGATVLVLEGAERARGARPRERRPLAAVAASGSAFDATAPRSGWGTGHRTLGAALRRTLERSGLAPADVDLVVAGASGSRAGDRLEALTLRQAWGRGDLPPVVAPKGVTGELGGGQLAAGVLALAGAAFGPTPGFREADPELGIVPWQGGVFLRRPRRVLLTSLAVGGGAAWLVLEQA